MHGLIEFCRYWGLRALGKHRQSPAERLLGLKPGGKFRLHGVMHRVLKHFVLVPAEDDSGAPEVHFFQISHAQASGYCLIVEVRPGRAPEVWFGRPTDFASTVPSLHLAELTVAQAAFGIMAEADCLVYHFGERVALHEGHYVFYVRPLGPTVPNAQALWYINTGDGSWSEWTTHSVPGSQIG